MSEASVAMCDKMIAKLRERVYLGDGVYAYHDGYLIWVMTQGSAHIALEPEVLAALDAYRKTVNELIASINAV